MDKSIYIISRSRIGESEFTERKRPFDTNWTRSHEFKRCKSRTWYRSIRMQIATITLLEWDIDKLWIQPFRRKWYSELRGIVRCL